MKPPTGYHSRRRSFPLRLSSHRLGFILILLSLVWGMYLIRVQLNDRRSQSEYLKERIISLSKEYIDAVAKEKGIVDMAEETEEVREMKRATAVLLQSMLFRLRLLEKQVENVIINSTSEFKHLTKAIKYLNSTIRNMNKTHDDDACFIPDHPEYPKCKEKVQWLKDNWRTNKKYQEHGVNGSLCSVLQYLSRIEQWCPATEFMKGATEVCVVPLDPGFPHCKEKVQWMKTYWRSHPKYQSHGVDGSLCSFLSYLSEVENFCPLRPGRHVRDDCEIPTALEYPQCPKKIAWMREFWKSDPCYERDHGVNGSVCSFIIYLSEVEGWCPLLPGRTGPKKVLSPSGPALRPHLNRKDAQGLLNLLTDKNPVKFQWIKRRIQVMWPHWQTAYSALAKKRDLTVTVRKKIIIFIGVLAGEDRFHFATDAGKGGPLGELVQWSDLIATLYVLGHDITVTVDLDEVQRALGSVNGGQKKSCPQRLPEDIDLVYIDYIGLKDLNTKIGALLPQFLCKLRVLDSFGTEAQFNFAYSGDNVPGGNMGLFGRYNLNLRQFLTMFPHSPDNSFLGFVVNTVPLANLTKKPRRKARALVYGKHINFWKDLANKVFLQIANKYFEIHATVGGASEAELKAVLPPFVINHGVVSQSEVQRLLNESMVFIGLGFPYEGPAPLEAISSGCFFINPKFNPPQNRLNTKFFINKPTLRLLTSQHPYCEEFIGPPYVFTIDVNNLSEVEDVMKKIMISEVSPYLPFEFTHEGMLERVNALVQNQDFCVQNQWPPLKALITVKGDQGKSCKETCLGQGMVCEPEFFKLINTQTLLTMNGFPCNSSRLEQVSSLIAPGFRKEPPTCILQTQTLMYSCTGTSPTTSRLCPCRKYKKGQVQLCQQC